MKYRNLLRLQERYEYIDSQLKKIRTVQNLLQQIIEKGDDNDNEILEIFKKELKPVYETIQVCLLNKIYALQEKQETLKEIEIVNMDS